MIDLDEVQKKLKEDKKEKKKEKNRSDDFGDLDLLYYGWGVRPDQYVFAKVIACGLDKREIICKLVSKEKERSGGKGFRLLPGETYGETFKLYKSRSQNGELCFKGKYPFESGKKEDGMKKGTFHPYEGELKK